MLDVPKGETHNGQDWRGLLRKSDVPDLPNKFTGPKNLRLNDQPKINPEPLRVLQVVEGGTARRYVLYPRAP